MNENLKVNFKTSTLEWKRKFNKLVESSIAKIETSNIEQLTDAELSSLQCGDVVRKKTGNQFHCYIVTYKEENHGICLSYFAAGYTETISYDYIESHWVFNSKDVIEIPTEENIKDLAKDEIESAESGTIQDSLGLDSSGNLVKGLISGGTKLYKHTLTSYGNPWCEIIATSSELITKSNIMTFPILYALMLGSKYKVLQIWEYGDGESATVHFNVIEYGTSPTLKDVSVIPASSGITDVVTEL